MSRPTRIFNNDWLFDQCQQLNQLETEAAFYQHLSKLYDDIGFDQFLFSTTPVFQTQNMGKLICNFDREWLQHYVAQSYYKIDPLFQHALAGNSSPYLWDPQIAKQRFTPWQKQLYAEAQQTQLVTGVTTPVKNSFGAVSTVSLSFKGHPEEFQRFYQPNKAILNLLSYSINESIFKQLPAQTLNTHQPNLSTKQLEVLQWLSEGYTYQQISYRMNVGVSTIRKHIAVIHKKLNAKNTVHAIALAIKWQLIR